MVSFSSTISRLSLSYTCINLFLMLLSFPFKFLRHFISANTFLVAIAAFVAFFYIPFYTFIRYYQSLFPFLGIYSSLCLHIIVHFAPLFFTERITYNTYDTSTALLVFWLWYVIVRQNIQSIYIRKVSLLTYNRIVLVSSLLFVLLSVFLQK